MINRRVGACPGRIVIAMKRSSRSNLFLVAGEGEIICNIVTQSEAMSTGCHCAKQKYCLDSSASPLRSDTSE